MSSAPNTALFLLDASLNLPPPSGVEMELHIDDYWLPMDRKWIEEWIEQIPSFLRAHPELLVGDRSGDEFGQPEYMCYVSKHANESTTPLKAYFQPYHLSDREPLCGLEVLYEVPSCELSHVTVHPMSKESLFQ